MTDDQIMAIINERDRLLVEVNTYRQMVDTLNHDIAMCEDENESYQASVQRLTEANAAFHQAVNRQKAEIAEWTNAARKVFKGPQDADDYEDFDRRREAMEKEGLAALEDLMLGNGWANVESESTLAHMKRQLEAMADERDYWKAMTDGEEVIDWQRQEISRLREALTWAVGFIRCQHPNAYLEYEGMRNAVTLVDGDLSIWSGEFQRASARAEIAEYERDRLKKQLDNILAMTGMVVHAAEPECTAARCGCVSLSPEEAVAEVLVRNGIKPHGNKR